MMWHLAHRGEAARLAEVLSAAAREESIDWGHPAASNGLGASPLLVASLLGHRHCVEVLLDARMPGTPIDLTDTFGNSPLTAAVARGRTSCVRLLLQAGADPNHRNAHGLSVMEVAVDHGRAECASLLIQNGAVPPPHDEKPRKPERPFKGGMLQWERGAA